MEETLASLIRYGSKAILQNSFMRLTDKEVAVALRLLDDDVKNSVLTLLPAAKAERIREEMNLFRWRVRVPAGKYNEILSHVIAVLQGKSRGNVSSYIKPKSN